jgi:hypothetical protein
MTFGKQNSLSRRDFLAGSAAATGLAGVPGLGLGSEPAEVLRGQADHCIFVWLGGGQGQIDTWDPKRRGDPKAKKYGSYYDSVPTAIPGVKVCQPLSRCADILDRFILMRSANHDTVDEHAAATNRMHTGRTTSGTIVYPSLGSIVAHERPIEDSSIPAYVVMGYPNLTRGPGFLGAKHGYLYLTSTDAGPPALQRPADVTGARFTRRIDLLRKLRTDYLDRHAAERLLEDYDSTIEKAEKLAGPQFMRLFQLENEAADLRESYGGEFGQRCLLARRLIEAGVRFVEVSHNLNFLNGTGWDVHNEGILNQHLLIDEMDRALSSLVLDLERRKLLDRTLVVVSTEFGRPAGFDARGGRGHHSGAFSIVLAGGGLKLGQTIGETDEKAMKILSDPVSVPDLFATICTAMGIDPRKELYAGDRPVPITDMGTPVRAAFG